MNAKYLRQVTIILLLLFTCFSYRIVLAEEDISTSNEQTPTSPLVLPEDDADADADADAEKECLTVCKEWGESCVINPRTGNRKCRRTCTQLTEECI